MKTITIRLPEELFGVGAEAQRIHPLKMKYVRQIAGLQIGKSLDAFDSLCAELATVWPEWNLIDSETSEPLPQPQDDPLVFMELEVEAFQFFGGQGLAERPTMRRK